MTGTRERVNSNLLASYRSMLGEGSWARLHTDIQKRFSPEHAQRSVTYRGIMTQVYLSLAGKLLSQSCRLIGTPLTPYARTDIPTVVKVYPNKALGGMTWDRFYNYPGKKVVRVRSTKCIQNENQLIEVVGFGFGMYLNVYEKCSAICFKSTRYFLQLGQWRITIPDLLTPGKTIVSQSVLADGRFEFRLDVVHPMLGHVFKQIGNFRELEATDMIE